MSLVELAVADLALLERVRVRLGPGFTVVTGETGAGKSLLIDALGLALGGRADPGLVRHGAPRARVEAVFELPGRHELLIAAREVTAGGRSLARLDDETVTATRLAEVVGPLVEIHGQHEQQRLLSSAWQRELLDAYGGHAAQRQAVAAAVAAWRANRAAMAELPGDPGEIERRVALAEHAADEIEAAAPRQGEVEALRTALAAAAHGEAAARLANAVRERLIGEGTGARDVLARAAREAEELARLDGRYGSLAERLSGLAAEADDAAADVRRLAAGAEHDPSAVAAMESRLGELYALLRKYGDSEAAVIAHGAASRAEADRLRGVEAERVRRAADDERLETAAHDAAAALSGARREVAQRFAAAVGRELLGLGIGGARFEVRLEPGELDASGSDEVAFLLAPNRGEPPRPLARIASGGELSRVALAVKSVLAGADSTPTLIFDEVDAGIGGRSADPVGRALRALAHDHQVIVVTHLPQIAAHADRHLLIEKTVEGTRTVTRLRELEGEARVAELTAMLGGVVASGAAGAASRAGTAGAEAAARELLARAAAAGPTRA